MSVKFGCDQLMREDAKGLENNKLYHAVQNKLKSLQIYANLVHNHPAPFVIPNDIL